VAVGLFLLELVFSDGSLRFEGLVDFGFEGGVVCVEAALFGGLIERRSVCFPELVYSVGQVGVFLGEGQSLREVTSHSLITCNLLYYSPAITRLAIPHLPSFY